MGRRKSKVEAVQFTGQNHDEVAGFVGCVVVHDGNGTLPVPTTQGSKLARAGDYIVRGISGRFFLFESEVYEQLLGGVV